MLRLQIHSFTFQVFITLELAMVTGNEKVFQENYLIKTFVIASNDPNYKQEIVLLYGNIFETHFMI